MNAIPGRMQPALLPLCRWSLKRCLQWFDFLRSDWTRPAFWRENRTPDRNLFCGNLTAPAIIAVVIMAGCASGPRTKLGVPSAASGPAWSIQLGPVIDLLAASTTEDVRVKALVDSMGQVHVLIASDDLKSLYDLQVGKDGVLKQTLVQSGVLAKAIDGALDGRGRLHVLLGNRHFILDGQTWVESDRTPWALAGFKAENPRFVHGAPNLTWAFTVSGKDVGANWRFNWFGFGNALGGFIWPWPSRAKKTVIVAENAAGEMNWTVLDREGKTDAIASGLASDHAGDIFVLYTQRRTILQQIWEPRFARIDAQELGADVPQGEAGSAQGGLRLRSVVGGPLHDDALWLYGSPDEEHQPWLIYFQGNCLAVDPGDGGALFGWRLLWRAGTWNATSDIRAFDARKANYEWHAAASGRGTFHGAYVLRKRAEEYLVTYAKLSGDVWSDSVEVGVSSGRSVDIASVEPESAFVVWAIKNAIVGRWIETMLRNR